MRSARATLVLVVAAFAAVAGVAGAAPEATAPEVTGATALVASVALPGQPASSSGQLSAPPTASTGGPFSYPEDGSALRVGAATASTTAQSGTSSSAEGTVRALAVSLLGGEIVAESVEIRAGAAAGQAGATGDAGASRVTGLVVLGQPVTANANVQIPLADWGTLEVLGGTSSTSAAKPRSARSDISGLRVRLIAEHAGLPAGTELVVGVASAVAVAVPAPATPATPPPHGSTVGTTPPAQGVPGRSTNPAPRPQPAPSAPREPGRSIPGAPPELVRPAPEVTARLSQSGYVFPLFGPAAFGDTFGAFRADVAGKWHHGEDLVAPAGTPVLAVASGTLFSVGWNDIGGWRLWLRDDAGNEFYYAHLSAYSPLAVAGRRVKAGDVLGFVGDSGDADGGVTHLHFEIHPVDLVRFGYDGAVAPYSFLIAWRRAEDVSFASGRRFLASGGAAGAPVALARAGAVLLEARDISTASGLVPGALKRALAGRERRPSGTP